LPVIAKAKTRREGEVRSRRIATDRDAHILLAEESRHRHDLLERDGVLRLGSQRVVDAGDHHTGPCRVLAHHTVMRVETEKSPATAM
jgi:hypothetical protein